jgi:hypothetical protein
MRHAVSAADDDRSNPDFREILLILQALVSRNDDTKSGIDGSPKQNPVPETTPALITDRSGLVAGQFVSELRW